MKEYVTDTHGLIWHLTDDDRKMGVLAKETFKEADHGICIIWIPTICLIEMIYLCEKPKQLISQAMVKNLLEQLKPDTSYRTVALTKEIVLASIKIPRSLIPDMPDRIIAATALFLNCPLITLDNQISKYAAIDTVWH